MIPESRVPAHPGEMLVEEFLKPANQSQAAFARALGVPLQRINEIATGKRGVTPDTAWKLAAALGTTPQFWMNLQANHDLAIAKPEGWRAANRIGPRQARARPRAAVAAKKP